MPRVRAAMAASAALLAPTSSATPSDLQTALASAFSAEEIDPSRTAAPAVDPAH